MPAAAQPARRVLLSAEGLSARDAAALERELEARTGRELLGPAEAARMLENFAADAPEPSPPSPAPLLAEARRAYRQLELRDAKQAYGRAIDALLAQRPPASAATVASALFERALVLLALGEAAPARDDLMIALQLDRTLEADPNIHGPPVLRAVAEAAATLAQTPAARYRVEVVPADARVEIDGRGPDSSGAFALRGPGPHLLVAVHPLYEPLSRFIDVDRRGHIEGPVRLPEASPALRSAQVMEAWRSHTGSPSFVAAPSATVSWIGAAAGASTLLRCQRRGGRLRGGHLRATEIDLASFTTTWTADIADSGQPLGLDVAALSRAWVGHDGGSVAQTGSPADGEEASSTGAVNPVASTPAVMNGTAADAAASDALEPPADVSTPWYGHWYVWTIAIAAATGVAAFLLFSSFASSDNELVIHGPR